VGIPALYYVHGLLPAARWLKWSRRLRVSTLCIVLAASRARQLDSQTQHGRRQRRVMLAAKSTAGDTLFSPALSPVWVCGVQGLVAAAAGLSDER
jgi:hypothetical protein